MKYDTGKLYKYKCSSCFWRKGEYKKLTIARYLINELLCVLFCVLGAENILCILIVELYVYHAEEIKPNSEKGNLS